MLNVSALLSFGEVSLFPKTEGENVADFLFQGNVLVRESMVKKHLEQLASRGFISSFEGQNRLEFHDLGLHEYCRYLNAKIGEENAFCDDQICCPSGHYLVIFKNESASRAAAKHAMHDAIDRVDARRTWRS